jgi:glyoxylase-like metal-dependent hydrolase (beta-lactamase superfamily II)
MTSGGLPTMFTESPRQLSEGVYWITDCLVMEHEGEQIHAYSSAYLVHGEDCSLLVDTGHPKDWASVEGQLDRLHAAGVPSVKYFFPTHAEVPHAANLGRLFNKYPDAVAVGDIRDYHLFFPEFADRLSPMRCPTYRFRRSRRYSARTRCTGRASPILGPTLLH